LREALGESSASDAAGLPFGWIPNPSEIGGGGGLVFIPCASSSQRVENA
jgi:hypothetical protein